MSLSRRGRGSFMESDDYAVGPPLGAGAYGGNPGSTGGRATAGS